MVKPYEPRELLARVRTILRRSKPVEHVSSKAQLYQFDDWSVNLNERSLTRMSSGTTEPLTTTEFEILYMFVTNPHTVFNRNQLLDAARGRESFAGDRAIDVHIMRLRKKLGCCGDGAEFIKTIHGIGYSFIAVVKKVSA